MSKEMNDMFDNFDIDVVDESLLEDEAVEDDGAFEDEEEVEVVEAEVVEDTPKTTKGNKTGKAKESKPKTEVVSKKDAPIAVPEFNFDFGKLNIPGLITGDMGIEVSRYAVDKVKFTTSSRARISIITSQVVVLKTHYIEDVGSILCFDGACCKMDGMPRIKYLFPVVVYDTDKKGKPVSTSIENKVLAVGKGVYDTIMTIHELQEETGGISSVDLLVTCTKEDYQEITLQSAGPANWKRKESLAKQVTEFWSKNMEHLYESIARQISEEDFLTKVGASGAISPTDGDVSFDDVFNN